MSFMGYIKSQTPPAVRRVSREVKRRFRETRNLHRTPKEVFTDVYVRNLWGQGIPSGNNAEFFSGPGSSAEAAKPYVDFVAGFIAKHRIGSVVDLGCGDFRVGRLLVDSPLKYIGVDIVEPLIAENNRRFRSPSVEFMAMDVIDEEPPDAELCLIREVLQHLSNVQIKAVLARIRKYPFALVTDIQPGPIGSFKCNKDKVHGASSRIVRQSALCLDQPPFNIESVELVLESAAPYFDSFSPYGQNCCLRTFLIRHPAVPLGRPAAGT